MFGPWNWITLWPFWDQVSCVIAIAYRIVPWTVSDWLLPCLLNVTCTTSATYWICLKSNRHKKHISCCAAWIHHLNCWQVICIVVFKNGHFRDLYNWHSLAYSYWPIWARQVGCMLQILPIILVPLGCIVQTWRYLSSGPPDILDVSAGILAFITCPFLHFLHFCFYFLFLASLILPPFIITTLSSHSYSHFLHFSL